MDKRTILLWFRNDLRICDNEMISLATEKASLILPVYIYDPRLFTVTNQQFKKTGVMRAKFINDSVRDLQQSFRAMGGNLIIEHGLPEEILPVLAKKYNVDEVYHHREVAQEETKVSGLVEEALWKLQLNLRHFIGHTLYHKEDLPFPIRDIPNDFNVFKRKTIKEGVIRPSIEVGSNMNFVEVAESSDVPDLTVLGFDKHEIAQALASPIKGGEGEAVLRLNNLIKSMDSDWPESGLSPWLNLGCLSVHTFYHALVKQTNFSKATLNRLMDELWWHDYYRFMFKKHKNQFFKLEGFASQAPAHTGTDQDFEKWKNGTTENVEVNEIMKSLNETGYIDRQKKLIAASYLVHDLNVNWLLGAAYFEEKLIDYSPANNYGSWAHVAGVGSSSKHNQNYIVS